MYGDVVLEGELAERRVVGQAENEVDERRYRWLVGHGFYKLWLPRTRAEPKCLQGQGRPRATGPQPAQIDTLAKLRCGVRRQLLASPL